MLVKVKLRSVTTTVTSLLLVQQVVSGIGTLAIAALLVDGIFLVASISSRRLISLLGFLRKVRRSEERERERERVADCKLPHDPKVEMDLDR